MEEEPHHNFGRGIFSDGVLRPEEFGQDSREYKGSPSLKAKAEHDGALPAREGKASLGV